MGVHENNEDQGGSSNLELAHDWPDQLQTNSPL